MPTETAPLDQTTADELAVELRRRFSDFEARDDLVVHRVHVWRCATARSAPSPLTATAAGTTSCAPATPPRRRWSEADAASLPLPDASYDVALCQMGLMFVEDRASAVAELHRVLTPGGRVVINTPGRIQPFFEAMERAIAEHVGPQLGAFVRGVVSMHDPSAVAGLLGDAGFVDVSSKEYTAHFTLPGPAEVPVELHQPHAHGPDRGRGIRRGQGGHGTPGRRGVGYPRRRRDDPTRPADGPRLGPVPFVTSRIELDERVFP